MHFKIEFSCAIIFKYLQEYFQHKIGRKIRIFRLGWNNISLIKKSVVSHDRNPSTNVTVAQDTDSHMTSLGDLCIGLALFAGFKSQNTREKHRSTSVVVFSQVVRDEMILAVKPRNFFFVSPLQVQLQQLLMSFQALVRNTADGCQVFREHQRSKCPHDP